MIINFSSIKKLIIKYINPYIYRILPKIKSQKKKIINNIIPNIQRINNVQQKKSKIYKIMSCIVQQQTTTTHQFTKIGKSLMNHLKSFSFFIYYEKNHLHGQNHMMNLDKLSFKLKYDKNQYMDKSGDYNKNVQLSFYDLENQKELSSSLHDLKLTAQQNKTKLIFFSSQSLLINFYIKAKTLNIHIDNIPISIYTSGIHSDFSKFLGWGFPSINNLSDLSVTQVQRDVRKWVESPTEKIDMWSALIKVSQQGGSIQKLNQATGTPTIIKSHQLRQLFFSNLCIGYHPSLLYDYQQKKTYKCPSFLDRLIYSFQGMKKFCCVGQYDMRQATGVIKIDFTDQKGQHQIMKYLRDPQEQGAQYVQSKKQKNNKKNILSVLFSNIDRFFGQRIKGNLGSKMNDHKLQLITFQSLTQATIIASISGQINMQLSPDHPVFLQVNDNCYKLEKPLTIKIQSIGNAKITINKETLCC